METNGVNLKISDDIIRPIIEKQIAAGIANAIGDSDKFIQSVVNSALKMKVASDGKVSNYSSDNRFDYFEILAASTIRRMAQEALEIWCKSHEESIRKELIKSLEKNKKTMAEKFINSLIEKSESRYSLEVKVI